MASVPGSREEVQPPALPIKQRRPSSTDSDGFTPGMLSLKFQNFAYNEVFDKPTDCHAAQCPIHQPKDPFKHQRFFSDNNPPPVPKKKLARTHSLPGFNALSPCPRSPLSPLQICPQEFANPLYMMAPILDTHSHEETEDITTPTATSASSLLSISKLSFDTPDEHLPSLFCNFTEQQVVSQGIQYRHLLFLRSMAQKMEAQCMLQRVTSERDDSLYQPQNFLLIEGSKPKQIGDKIYYNLHCPKLPNKLLALKVFKQTSDAPTSPTKHQHANLQEILAYFQPMDCSRLQPPIELPWPPESIADDSKISPPTVQSFLQKGYCVSIERDLPDATLQDFVLQSTLGLEYDRQICLLLLQILKASNHLCNSAATAELKPQDIFLVWPSWEKDKKHRLKLNAPEGWSGPQSSKQVIEKESISSLWKTFGSPRVVLTPKSSTFSDVPLLASIKVQIGNLIQFMLNQDNQTSKGSVPAVSKSSYCRGLLFLSSTMQRESRLQMMDMIMMLHMILWGPRLPFFDQRACTTIAVENWLIVKRALLLMKLAEKGLFQDRPSLDWEDCLCLQYLSMTESEAFEGLVTKLDSIGISWIY